MQEKNSFKEIFILTFDLEDWFHILDTDYNKDNRKWDLFESRIYENTYNIINILNNKNIKATFFVLGWIAQKYPDLVKYVSNHGHEIGTHSQNHILVYNCRQESFRKDILKSIDTIESVINKKVEAFRAPGFSIKADTLWAFKIMGEVGISIDSSIFPARRGHGGIKNFHIAQPFIIKSGKILIKEFPINIYKFLNYKIPFSGGGYFRIMPYGLLNYFFRNSDYIMTYFHPRDFDPYQPIIKELPIYRKIKCYYGIQKSLYKFNKIIDDFKFMDITTATKIINWNNKPILDFSNL
mgnify:CR=1 FL=1